jgi:hypothetical protein
MPSAGSKNELYRSVCVEVLDAYDEIKSVNGTSSVAGFYNGLGRIRSGGGLNPRIVRTNPTDFIADIEIGARKSLSNKEYAVFDMMYLSHNDDIRGLVRNADSYERVREIIKLKLGRYFSQNGIYPLANYFKPKDLR